MPRVDTSASDPAVRRAAPPWILPFSMVSSMGANFTWTMLVSRSGAWSLAKATSALRCSAVARPGVIGLGHAAGGHFGERSGGEAGGSAVNIAVLDSELDGRKLLLDDVGQQVKFAPIEL